MNSAPGIRPYLAAAAGAEKDGLEQHESYLVFVDTLDEFFRSLVTGRIYGSLHPVAGFLAMNSHSLFLAAVGTSLRGQFPPTFMILRGSVESALYAYLVAESRSDGDVWLNREKEAEKARRTFTANRAIQKIEKQDPNLASRARETYQWMIEFGGHPNHRSVIDHIRRRDALPNGDIPVSLAYINSPDSVATVRSLSACIENACLALAFLCHAMPEHPSSSSIFPRIWEVLNEFQTRLAHDGYYTPEEIPT